MMKIAVLGPSYPLRGGIAHHTGMLVKNLIAAGNEVKLLSFRKQFPQFLFPGKTQFDLSASVDAPESEAVFIPWSPTSWKRIAEAVIAGNFDLLVCIHWTPFTVFGYSRICKSVKLKSKIPILFILHNVIPHEGMPGKKTLTRMAFNYAGGFITQSQQVEQELFDFYPPAKQKWHTIVPHPVYNFQDFSFPSKDEARRRLGITESRSMLYFGLVRGYKGLKILLKAFPLVLEKFDHDIRLVIAGEFYEQPEAYMELMEQLQILDKVTVHNRFVPNEEVGRYFSAADVVVLPYVSASQSGVVQAAFGFNKPVVSTQVGGLPEVISDGITGILCPPENPQALAEAIVKFYNLSETVDWSKNIAAERTKYSWDRFHPALEEFMDSMGIVDDKG